MIMIKFIVITIYLYSDLEMIYNALYLIYCKKHFITQERFNKLIYGIYTTIKCGTRQAVKLHLVSRS